MRKKITPILGVIVMSSFFNSLFAQLGINTSNPQALFHIDAAKDNPASGIPSATQQTNDFVVTNTANIGIGTTAPTEKLDIATGNARIRNINSNVGVGGSDRVVVADANGILKTIDFTAYSLFHARLAADQNIGAAASIVTLLFASPVATSPFYSYNTTTGYLTFNKPGNYLVTLQASFADISAGAQLLLGIRPSADNAYLGRGSHYSAVTTPALSSTARIGELMNYTTVIVVPTAGYQIRFTAAPNEACTVLSTEIGPTGSGNVTNVTVQKI